MGDDFDFDTLLSMNEPKPQVPMVKKTSAQNLFDHIVNGPKIELMCLWLKQMLSAFTYLSDDKRVIMLGNTLSEGGVKKQALGRKEIARLFIPYYIDLYIMSNWQKMSSPTGGPISIEAMADMLMSDKRIKKVIGIDH